MKKKKARINKFDFLILILILIIFLSTMFFIIYYFYYNNNSCLESPLTYGSKQLEKDYNGNFSGIGNIFIDNPYPITIIFNSTNIRYYRNSEEIN